MLTTSAAGLEMAGDHLMPRRPSPHLWVYASAARDLLIGASFPFGVGALVAVAAVTVTPPEHLVYAYASVGLLLVIGLVLVLLAARRYAAVAHLLTHGTIAAGQITECEKRVPWYTKHQRTRTHVTYAYTTPAGPRQGRFDVPSWQPEYEWLRAGLAIRAVFDPAQVDHSLLLLPQDPIQ